MMQKTILILSVLLISSAVLAQAAVSWEVRKKPNGTCEVVRVAASPGPGSRVAGPFKTKKRADDELARLRKTPKCKR